jgi:hypothetical protein
VARQAGVLRTNCMDNLDRTNVVQSLFARRAALAAVPGALAKARASGCSVLTSPFPGFEAAFNDLWANNADAVSLLYSGTGALKTDFTRTGKRTTMGALADGVNSVKRYVLNNLVDGRTQDAWDLFVGRYIPERAAHARASAAAAAALPIQRHLAGRTPAMLMLEAALVFALTGAAAVMALAPRAALTEQLLLGATAATLVLAGLSGLLIKKGTRLGARLVSRPAFCPPLTHHGRDSGLVGGGAPNPASYGASGAAVVGGMAGIASSAGAPAAAAAGGADARQKVA